MHKTLAIAIGAGLASALLFIASAKSAGLAVVVAYLTPLPLMIATLGFGRSAGLVAALVSSGVIIGMLDWRPGLFFAALLALPSWWLATLALRARTLPAPQAGNGAAPPPRIWYPVGWITAWGAAIVAAVVIGTGVLVTLHFGGFEKTVAGLAGRLDDIMGPGAASELPSGATASRLIRVLPILMAASAFLMLMINLWLAGRTVQSSGLLARPWPPIPETLRLPKFFAGIAIACAGLALTGGAVGVAAGVVSATFAMAFVLQGLGAAHALTRGLAPRRLILAIIYLVTITVVPSLLALSVLGIVDCLLPLRGRPQGTKSSLPNT